MDELEADDVYLSWMVCPCGCGKEVSFQTDAQLETEAEYEKMAQTVWQEIVNREGLEEAVDSIFHKEEERHG
jgi:hypothetical protein